MNDDLRRLVEQEALAAGRAAPQLRDEPVAAALGEAAALVRERADEILVANEADVEAAKSRLDEGMLDRLRLDRARVDAMAKQVEAVAAIEPLEREITSRTLENGLQISERRIPIGVVGANFEARPKSPGRRRPAPEEPQHGCAPHGRSRAAHRDVLVDDVCAPPWREPACRPEPSARPLLRSEGVRTLVTMPERISLVILRGSGPTTAELATLAAEHGVRTLAHAEGGCVLYVHPAAQRERALKMAEDMLDRLGV